MKPSLFKTRTMNVTEQLTREFSYGQDAKLLLSKTMTSHRLKMWKLHCPRRMVFLGFKLWNPFPNLSHESTDSKFFSPNFLRFEIFIPTQEASNGTWNPEIWPPSYWRRCDFSLRYYKVIEIIGVWLINIGRV